MAAQAHVPDSLYDQLQSARTALALAEGKTPSMMRNGTFTKDSSAKGDAETGEEQQGLTRMESYDLPRSGSNNLLDKVRK